ANDGDLGFGTSSPQTRMHIVGGDGSIRISDTDQSGVNKFGYVVGPHFTNGEEELVGLEVSTRAGNNVVSLGGGNPAYNSATILRFFTGENTTTTNGTERMRINVNGQIAVARTNLDTGNMFQIGTDTTNGNGASLTNAGVWTDASSRANKIDIHNLSAVAAVETIKNLEPVTYKGKQDESKESYVGFIAEDVPDLVAMNNRKGIAAIEIAAVLTTVVKMHQETIENQRNHIESLETRLSVLEAAISDNANE
ncbi:MAG: tail fiber domain-containing protein, partial [Rhizobiaceae bacterium]